MGSCGGQEPRALSRVPLGGMAPLSRPSWPRGRQLSSMPAQSSKDAHREGEGAQPGLMGNGTHLWNILEGWCVTSPGSVPRGDTG